MYEFIITLHVSSMIASMALMSGAIGAGLFGKKSAVTLASFGTYSTVLGFMTGVGLMLDAPLSMQCATLTAYLISVLVLYRVGFGFGDVTKARFIRQTS